MGVYPQKVIGNTHLQWDWVMYPTYFLLREKRKTFSINIIKYLQNTIIEILFPSLVEQDASFALISFCYVSRGTLSLKLDYKLQIQLELNFKEESYSAN